MQLKGTVVIKLDREYVGKKQTPKTELVIKENGDGDQVKVTFMNEFEKIANGLTIGDKIELIAKIRTSERQGKIYNNIECAHIIKTDEAEVEDGGMF